jgi:hypothetical protein
MASIATVSSSLTFASADIATLSAGSAARATFEADFKTALVASLAGHRVDEADITVDSITAGSVVVGFSIICRDSALGRLVSTDLASVPTLTVGNYVADMTTLAAPVTTLAAPVFEADCAEACAGEDCGVWVNRHRETPGLVTCACVFPDDRCRGDFECLDAPSCPRSDGGIADPFCTPEDLETAGFRITTDTSDDSLPLTLCVPCDPYVEPNGSLVWMSTFLAVVACILILFISSCIFFPAIWCCQKAGQEPFEPLSVYNRPTTQADAKLKPLRKEARRAISEYRFSDLANIAEQMQVIDDDGAAAELTANLDPNSLSTFGSCGATVELLAFLAHLLVFAGLLFLRFVLDAQDFKADTLTLEQCEAREPLFPPPRDCMACDSLRVLYPMCQVAGSVPDVSGCTPFPFLPYSECCSNSPRAWCVFIAPATHDRMQRVHRRQLVHLSRGGGGGT